MKNRKCGNHCVENVGDYCSVVAARQNLKILPLVIYSENHHLWYSEEVNNTTDQLPLQLLSMCMYNSLSNLKNSK
jgi:galactose-1-phosphate uridylyltransferase